MGVREAHILRTILLGISFALLNAFMSSFSAMIFFILKIPSIPYQFLFPTAVLYFVGARYFSKNILYPAIITEVLLSLFIVYLMASNGFMSSNEFSRPFLETLIEMHPSILRNILVTVSYTHLTLPTIYSV